MLLLVEDDNLLLLIVVIDEYVVAPAVGLKGTNSATSGLSDMGLSEPCTACRGHLVGLSWRRINHELVKDSLSFLSSISIKFLVLVSLYNKMI